MNSTRLADPIVPGQPGVAVVVSPHLDDAAISCGMSIQALKEAGWEVVAGSVFTDAPSGPVTDFARHFNCPPGARSVAEGLAMRRDEDRRALALIGARPVHLGFLDASMRRLPKGDWLIASYEAIRTVRTREERPLVVSVADRIRRLVTDVRATLVLAPAGVGGHVDHLIAREAVLACALAGVAVHWYEDLPYAFGVSTIASRPFAFGDERAMDLKLSTISMYYSQLGILGEDDPEGWMPPFRRHATDDASSDYVERVLSWAPG